MEGGINLFTYAGNNPVNFTDPEGKISVIGGVILGAYSVAAVVVFKDCMERCTQTRLPRDPNACEPPRNWGKCAELCGYYALLLGFGADPLGSASSTIGQEIGKRIGK